MDLKAQLLKEAARLEQKAQQIREAAKVLGGEPREPEAKRPYKRRKGVAPQRHRKAHRATCGQCGRGFLSYVKRYKANQGPTCSAKCRAKARRARIAKAPAQASLPLGRSKPVVLLPGDGVSKGA